MLYESLKSLNDIFSRIAWCHNCGWIGKVQVTLSSVKPRRFDVRFRCKDCKKKYIKKPSQCMLHLLGLDSPIDILQI